MIHGFLLVDKPKGITSFDVIRKLKKKLPKNAPLGHTGTLDPFATGLLVVALGDATKLCTFLTKTEKGYDALLEIGEKTDSGDYTGVVLEKSKPLRDLSISGSDLEKSFLEIQNTPFLQTPPMLSAKKIEGKKLYEYHREGIEVERRTEEKRIYALQCLELLENQIRFRAHVSSGTYIRSLGEWIAEKLGSCGHLKELRRTWSGKFQVTQAASLQDLEDSPPDSWETQSYFFSIEKTFSEYSSLEVTKNEATWFYQGNKEKIQNIFSKAHPTPVLFVKWGENFIGWATYDQRWMVGRTFQRFRNQILP